MLRVARILMPVDLGGSSGPALTHALYLADRLQIPLHLAHVCPTSEPKSLSTSPTENEAISKRILELVHDHLRRTSFPSSDPDPTLHPITIQASSVVEGLLTYVDTHDISFIVAGPHPDRGPVPALKSSIMDELVRRTSVPTLIIGAATGLPSTLTQRILVPIDFSDASRRALAHAKAWAALYAARLDVLHVLERPKYVALNTTDMLSLTDATLPNRKAKRRLETFIAETPGPDVSTRTHIVHGDAANQIGAFASENRNDLIVLASHGRTPPSSRTLGNVAEKVLRRVSVPAFVIKTSGTSLLQDDSSQRRTTR